MTAPKQLALPILRFERGQRVRVLRASTPPYGEPVALDALGTVARCRMGDPGAWVALDERSAVPGVHPFPADDSRGRHVLAYPEDCEAL